MITLDTIVTAKKQYVIDNVMPSDLDPDIEEGLKKKEELISKITNESILESNPDIEATIAQLNASGITEEDYAAFLAGTTSIQEKVTIPPPATTEIRYCIDDGPLQKYTKDSTIELQIPPDADEKKVTIATLTKLAGECIDTYWSKNAYWSIIPKGTNEPEVPDFIAIKYKGSCETTDDLVDSGDLANINYIRNNVTWKSIDDLINKVGSEKNKSDLIAQIEEVTSQIATVSTQIGDLTVRIGEIDIQIQDAETEEEKEELIAQKKVLEDDKALLEDQKEELDKRVVDLNKELDNCGAVDVSRAELECWCKNELLPPDQAAIPNYKITVVMNEGDMMFVEDEKLNYIYYQGSWKALPKGMSQLRSESDYQFVSINPIEFSEQDVPEATDKDSTGGTYCITDQLESTKFPIDTNTFVYLHLKANKKQEEKKQKSCSKSNNCSKQSSACDKGQTDVADQHNPNINENWLNQILDLLIKVELHPMQKSLRDLADAVIMLASAPLATRHGGVVSCPGAAALGNLVKSQIVARPWYNTVLMPLGDNAVDVSTSIVFDPAESAINAAVDAAISAFNDMLNNSVNTAVTNAMDTADSACSGCCGGASACAAACRAAGNEPLAAAVEAASSTCQGACNAALSKCNEECLNSTKNLLGEFSQSICDTRMQDTGDASSLAALMSTIGSAAESAKGGAEAAAGALASSYLGDVNTACAALDSVVAQAYSIIG